MTIPLVRGDGAIYLEPWLGKDALASYLGCGISWIEKRIAETRGKTDPFPCREIAGRIKFRASEVEPWLERHGHMRRVA